MYRKTDEPWTQYFWPIKMPKVTEFVNNSELTISQMCFIAYEGEAKDVLLLEADVANYKSLVAMCKSARLVLNCVGPVRGKVQKN